MKFPAAVVVCAFALGCGPPSVWVGKSPDRRHQVQVFERSGKQFVRIDDREGPRFFGVAIDGMVWSPNSAHLAYPARTKDGWVVVTDGRSGRSWTGIGEIVWSPDSAHLAYSAQDRGFWSVVKDDVVSAPFDGVMQQGIVFSPNSQRLAYVVQDGKNMRVIVDDQPEPKYQAIARLSFTADSQKIVYLARKDDIAYVVVNQELFGPYEWIADLVLSPVGARVASLSRLPDGWHVVVDGVASPVWDRIDSPVFSPRGDRLAYAAKRGKNEFVLVDGREGPPFDEVLPRSVVFDAAGTRVAYAARIGKTWRLVDGEHPGPEYDRVSRPVLAASVLGYVARKGNAEFVVIDGRQGAPFDHVGELVLSPDGRRHAVVATKDNRTFVVHDRGQTMFDAAIDETIVFTEDSQHWACLVGDSKRKKFFLTIDGSAQRPFLGEEWLTALGAGVLQSALREQNNGEVVRKRIRAELELATGRGKSAPAPVSPRLPR